MADTIGPIFHNGAHFDAWETRNCERCKKSYLNQKPQPNAGTGPCEIDNALTISMFSDGRVSQDIARRMDWLKSDGSTRQQELEWDCPERELVNPQTYTLREIGGKGRAATTGDLAHVLRTIATYCSRVDAKHITITLEASDEPQGDSA